MTEETIGIRQPEVEVEVKSVLDDAADAAESAAEEATEAAEDTVTEQAAPAGMRKLGPNEEAIAALTHMRSNMLKHFQQINIFQRSATTYPMSLDLVTVKLQELDLWANAAIREFQAALKKEK